MATVEQIAEELNNLTLLEAAQLSKLLQEKWGVSAAAPMAVAAVRGGGGSAGARGGVRGGAWRRKAWGRPWGGGEPPPIKERVWQARFNVGAAAAKTSARSRRSSRSRT